MKTLIKGGTLVNEGKMLPGCIVIVDDRITGIFPQDNLPCDIYDKVVDVSGCFVLPGVIDEHVHFREPGLERKADIESESRAAAFGGVTTFFDMPNTLPQTTSQEALADKFARGRSESHVNFSFFFGATNANAHLFSELDRHRIPGIKLFMGASTGNMLVDRLQSLNDIFSECARLELPLMVHCEDGSVISANMAKAKAEFGPDPAPDQHPVIRSAEACYRSTYLACQLAHKFGTRLHVAHLSTARELSLLGDNVTGEAVIAHLIFSDADYARLGSLIKCNPSVKSRADREALRRALTDGTLYTIGTDHAPHLLAEKQGGCCRASSGMPMVQFSLPAMLELCDEGVLSLPQLVTLMCHHPATLFSVAERGFLRNGYKADIVIVKPHTPWFVTTDLIQSKCKWSPLQGHQFQWRVMQTFCNGHALLADERHLSDDAYRGEEVRFREL